jgi:hypothetical protein
MKQAEFDRGAAEEEDDDLSQALLQLATITPPARRETQTNKERKE